jgi:hypothetical protein
MFIDGQFYHGRGDARDSEIASLYETLDKIVISDFEPPTEQVVRINQRLTALGVPQ